MTSKEQQLTDEREGLVNRLVTLNDANEVINIFEQVGPHTDSPTAASVFDPELQSLTNLGSTAVVESQGPAEQDQAATIIEFPLDRIRTTEIDQPMGGSPVITQPPLEGIAGLDSDSQVGDYNSPDAARAAVDAAFDEIFGNEGLENAA